MIHDINQYGVMIRPKSSTTLKAMTKAELIEYIRTLEHNYNVAVEFNERQARNIEAKLAELKGEQNGND
jgi:ribulose bisphosphate carboxylase small subunit